MGVFLGIKRTAIIAGVVVEKDIPPDFRPGEVFTEDGPAVTATLGLVAHKEVVEYARPGGVEQPDGSPVGRPGDLVIFRSADVVPENIVSDFRYTVVAGGDGGSVADPGTVADEDVVEDGRVGVVDQCNRSAVVAALPPSVFVVAVVRRFSGVVFQEYVVRDGGRGLGATDSGPVAPDPPAGDDESVHGGIVGPDQHPAFTFAVQDGRIGLNVPVP